MSTTITLSLLELSEIVTLAVCFQLKDVRANCLCASLLRTQFMSQRHATSCTSARAKEEIYSHEGIVTVALTSLRFNSLGWSVTPTFFWIDDFLY